MGLSSRIYIAALKEVFSDFGLWYGSLWAILNGKYKYTYTERKIYRFQKTKNFEKHCITDRFMI